ncbi:MAG: hypothetical protein QOK15_3604, partial [Nocardioidaceae bacterium]|nr:hypothetical protein [Nocardioidaceae bacterium]
MANHLIVLAETSTSSGGVSPWVVGGGMLLLLALLMAAVVAFGGVREHSGGFVRDDVRAADGS